MQIPSTTTNDAGWDEDRIEEGAGDGTSNYKIRHEKARPWEGSQVDDGELEGTANDCTEGEDSPRSNQLYTQEELVMLTRKIFGDEEDEADGTFWDDADGALWAAIDHQAKDEGADLDHRDEQSDTGGQSGESEGKAVEESKLEGLFGPTSNITFLPTSPKDGLLRSHQDEDDGQNVEVTQDVLEAAAVASSATVDISDGVNSSNDDTPPTTNTNTTTSTLLISPESPCTALRPSPPTQRPPQSENGFGNHSTNDPQPGELPEGHAGVNVNLSDEPVRTTQVEELEPCKPAVVILGEEESHCNTTRHIIRKKGLPDFSPTQPGIFSALIVRSSDDASLGKRKRSWEDDGDEGEEAFSLASVLQRGHQGLRPR